ncbi:MAG: 1-(5-phosphoribosyl)-5-[(5-phosphoribosylamino)methylideneamino]imidazole-4-carboxamide isomerase [Pseudomonadota bacterium]|nr:1-(5-phosphoribosyl)-5-[(5-phosphoribosylamino)methylideneamino]imidazole-4-carboxamide isomerase [Pseudomonadota bacterium]
MIFFPAIDLKDGQCVRLLQGDMKHATIYSCDPAGQARQFMQCGCEWLHVVDLNGAFEGRPVNGGAVEGILTATDMPVQLGGGIRDLATAANWLERGVRRVILGTAAVRDPDFVHDACRQFAGQVALGIDARAGRVAVEGWAEVSEMTALEVAQRFEDAGAAAIVYTDIERDGVMTGPNTNATVALAAAISTPVIASGGVSSLDDLRTLKQVGGDLLEGVISGRALYDGRLDAAQAVALLKGEVKC